MVRTDVSENGQPVRYRLKKNEILRGDKQFQSLIREGKTVRAGNILCHYRCRTAGEHQAGTVLRAGFSVPRRGISKAVDRNRLKRLMREAYRVNKQMLSELIQNNQCNVDLLFVYRGKVSTKPRYMKLHHVQPDMIRCLQQVGTRIAGRNNS